MHFKGRKSLLYTLAFKFDQSTTRTRSTAIYENSARTEIGDISNFVRENLAPGFFVCFHWFVRASDDRVIVRVLSFNYYLLQQMQNSIVRLKMACKIDW